MMIQQSINVTFLGTGCDYGYPTKEPVCILIERGTDRILLDCCPGILKQLTAVNREPQEIQTIFMSHMHPGHFLGFPSFVFGCLPKGRQQTLKVIVPQGKKNRILKVLEWCLEGIAGTDVFEIPTRPFLIDVEEGSADNPKNFAIEEDIALTTMPVRHSGGCIACRIEFKNQGMKIVYSGDTKYTDDMISLAKDATLLIHEAFFEKDAKEWAHARDHSTVGEAAEIAKKANVKTLALVHSHWTRYKRKGIADIFIREAQDAFDGEVLFPDDLDKIDLLSYSNMPYPTPQKNGVSGGTYGKKTATRNSHRA